MFNLSTFKFAINENVTWDVISNSEQNKSFQVKRRFTMHVCNSDLKIDSHV